jgi:hypothetical protein
VASSWARRMSASLATIGEPPLSIITDTSAIQS